MASNELREPTPNEMARQRLKALVEAQLWNMSPPRFVVPEPAVMPGEGQVLFDADGRVIGLSPDLLAAGYDIDPDSVSWQLSHPAEPEPELPAPGPDAPTTPFTERETYEAQRDLEEWRQQFSPRQRAKAKAALAMRRLRAAGRDKTRGIPDPNEKRGAPRKDTEFGALLKFTVGREKPDEQPELRPVRPTDAGDVHASAAPQVDDPALALPVHERGTHHGGPADPGGAGNPAVITVSGRAKRKRRGYAAPRRHHGQ